LGGAGGHALERIGETIVGYLLFRFPMAYLTHTTLGLEPGTLTGWRR
jgi:hypothetical protein